jgi:hypothetical protein
VPGLAHSKLERHGTHILHVVQRAMAEHHGEPAPLPPEGFVDRAADDEAAPSQGVPAWGAPAPLLGAAHRASLGAPSAAAAAAAAAARAAAAAEVMDGVDLAALDDDDFAPPPPKAPRTSDDGGGAGPAAPANAAQEWDAAGGSDWGEPWGDE